MSDLTVTGWESKVYLMRKLIRHPEFLGINSSIDSFYNAEINNPAGHFAGFYEALRDSLDFGGAVDSLIFDYDSDITQVIDSIEVVDSLIASAPTACRYAALRRTESAFTV